MIDFRYHIISLVAVFLALGVGIVVGTSGALDPFVSQQFTEQVARLEREIAGADDRIAELSERSSRRDALLDDLTPWAIGGLLADRAVVFVFDGGSERWPADAQESLLRAGASSAGRLTLTDRWELELEGSADALRLAVEGVTPAFDPGDDIALAALRLLGERFREPTGRALVDALIEAGFLALDGATADQWPPPDASVVAFASAQPADAPRADRLAALTLAASATTPTLVVSGTADDHHAVAVLRRDGDHPQRLSTFDSGAEDTTGIGTVLALHAALSGRGGDFGTGEGLRFLPEPVPASPAPAGA